MSSVTEQQDLSADSEFLLSDEEESRSRESPGSQLSWSSQLSGSCVKMKRSWVVEEAVKLVKLAVPIALMIFFQQLLLFVSLIFVGHISGDSLELDAAALALSFVNVTGLSVGIGLSTAADTLCSQTYGFKNYKRVGIILQRGILILAIAMFPILVVWLNSESILLLLQQPPCVARLTGHYAQIFCLALPGLFVFFMLQKYLQAQSIVWIFIVIGVLTNVISAALHTVLIFPADLGIIGASISVVVALSSAPVMAVVYVWARGLHKQTWGGWGWDSLREWGQFAKLGVPGLLMTSIEWWSFEIAAFITGSINKTELGINAVLINVISTAFAIPLGLGTAAGVRVGNELGAGRPLKAKRVTWISVGIIVCIATVLTTALLSSRKSIGELFTKDEAVIEGVATAIYVAGPLMFLDQVQGTIAGVLRGSGRQLLGAGVNFISYYVFGLPVGIVLALVADLGAVGVWSGLIIGSFMQTTIFSIVIIRTNWENQSQKAMKNARDSVQWSDGPGEEEEDRGSVASEDSSSSGTSSPDRDKAHLLLNPFQEDSHVGKSSEDIAERGHHINETTEGIPLVSFEDGECTPEAEPHCHHRSQKTKPSPKLLLYRSIFFIVGVVLLIAGGVASQYHPSSDYSDCGGSNASDNFNISSLYYHYSHTASYTADLASTHFVASPVMPSAGLVAPSSLLLHPSNVPLSTP